MWFSVTGLPVSRPWKIGLRRWVIAVMRATGLCDGRRVVAGIFAERALQHGLVQSTSNSITTSDVAGTSTSAVLHGVSSTGAPRRPPATFQSLVSSGTCTWQV